MKTLLALAIMPLLMLGGAALAAPGDGEKGKQIYGARCVLCHGDEGDGDGAVGDRLLPPPRDFTEALYKFKTTGPDDPVPNDDDLYRMIRDGMPGTAMPGWSDLLSDQDMWDLVAYLKIFAELEDEKPTDQIDYGAQVPSSPESIATGDKLFHDGDRCSECHGREGKGDAVKRLKDDAGARTWPRNLTKPWTFRVGNAPKDIFQRITVGITGTQMPSFADPKSKKKLGIEERWHVANYVASLAKTENVVRPENTVVIAEKVDGALPAGPGDPKWRAAPSATFFLVPQLIAKPRFFTPANDTISVRALYNDKEIAVHLEWDDRTKSIPGDEQAEKIAGSKIGEDIVAVQLPVEIPNGSEKPYFFMGDAGHTVNLWQWRSGTKDAPAKVQLFNAKGADAVEARPAADAGLKATGAFRDGTWRVVLTRPRATQAPGKDIQFAEGKFIPIAFAAWDGSNAETGKKHSLTTWYWLQLKPATGSRPVIWAVAVGVLIALLLIWWARTAREHGAEGET